MMRTSVFFVAGLVLVAALPVRGDVITGDSNAEFIDVGLNLDLLPLVGGGVILDADIGNIAPASGVAPSPYNQTNPVLGVDVEAGVLLDVVTTADVTAGTVTSNASSTVDGLSGPRLTQATHTIEDLDLSIADLPLLLPDLISITADAITVTSAISGDFGSILAAGSLDVTNLQIFVSGVQVGATLNGSIAPNTGIDLSTVLGGATLLLNQQIFSGDGITSQGLITNAINLQLTSVGVAGIGTLDGNVTVGLSQANVGLAPAAVPEPSSCLLLGMVGLGGVLHQRRRRARATAADGVSAA